MNDDINKILTEFPLEEKKKKETVILKKRLPNIKSKKRLIISGVIIIAIIILGLILIPNSCKCEICDICSDGIQVEQIKQQIIDKGYVEINDGNNILKLSPYLK